MDTTVAVWWETRYSEDQPRDDHGRFASGGAGDMPQNVSAWRDTVVPVERRPASFLDYYGTTTGYRAINDILRNDPRAPEPYHPEYGKATDAVEEIDRAIAAQQPLAQDTTLYRGVSGNTGAAYAELQPGAVITDQGYVSTATNQEIGERAARLLGGTSENQQLMVIDAPAGTRGINSEGVKGEQYDVFDEVLLPRGTTFEVTAQEDGGHLADFAGGIGTTHVRVLDTPVEQRAFRYAPDQPRDDHGRFSNGGGDDLKDAVGGIVTAAEQGGGSIHPTTGQEPTTGYMVSLPGKSLIEPDAKFLAEPNPDKIANWLRENQDHFDEPAMYIGVWHDTEHGEIVLDPSENVADRTEAIRLGVDRDQQSIWDVVKQEEIPTGGTGGRQATTYGYQTAQADQRHDGRGVESLLRTDHRADRERIQRQDLLEVWYETPARRYSDDQPRDDHGRFTSGGGNDSVEEKAMELMGERGSDSGLTPEQVTEIRHAVADAIARNPNITEANDAGQPGGASITVPGLSAVQFASALSHDDEGYKHAVEPGTFAATAPDGARIVINDTEAWTSKNGPTTLDLATNVVGAPATQTPYGVATHEIGHVEFANAGYRNMFTAADLLQEHGFGPRAIYGATGSQYGASHPQEGLAELYAQSHVPGFALKESTATPVGQANAEVISGDFPAKWADLTKAVGIP